MRFSCLLSASADKEEEQEQSPTCERTPGSVDDLMATPKPVRGLICGEQGDSSVVKYKITATPGYVSMTTSSIGRSMNLSTHASKEQGVTFRGFIG